MEEFDKILHNIRTSFATILSELDKLDDIKADAKLNFEECEDATSDILHFIELEDIGNGGYQTLGSELRKTRKERRIYSDIIGGVNAIRSEIFISKELEESMRNHLNRVLKYKPLHEKDRNYSYKVLDFK